jgi:hypothetical protein
MPPPLSDRGPLAAARQSRLNEDFLGTALNRNAAEASLPQAPWVVDSTYSILRLAPPLLDVRLRIVRSSENFLLRCRATVTNDSISMCQLSNSVCCFYNPNRSRSVSVRVGIRGLAAMNARRSAGWSISIPIPGSRTMVGSIPCSRAAIRCGK